MTLQEVRERLGIPASNSLVKFKDVHVLNVNSHVMDVGIPGVVGFVSVPITHLRTGTTVFAKGNKGDLVLLEDDVRNLHMRTLEKDEFFSGPSNLYPNPED